MNQKKLKNKDGFGTRVRLIRKRKGITQVELAKRIGVTQRGISYYENEADNPSMEVINKIAEALGVPNRLLVEYTQQPLDDEPRPIRSLQQKIKIIPKLPMEDQKYLVRTIEMLSEKHGISE